MFKRTQRIDLTRSVMLALEVTRQATNKVAQAEVSWEAANVWAEPGKDKRVITIHALGSEVMLTSECHLSCKLGSVWELEYADLDVDIRGDSWKRYSHRVTGHPGDIQLQELFVLRLAL